MREFTPENPAIRPDRVRAALWELALETARLAIAPEAVSRLDCLFAAETIDMARLFRDRFRPGAGLYVIEPWADAALFRGSFGLITTDQGERAFVDHMPAAALRYWCEPPEAGDLIEVLVGGPANVCEIIELPK